MDSLVSGLAELKDPHKNVTLSHEHSDYKWLSIEEAGDLLREHHEMRKLLTAAHEYLLRKGLGAAGKN